jgi:hypothetical protein
MTDRKPEVFPNQLPLLITPDSEENWEAMKQNVKLHIIQGPS